MSKRVLSQEDIRLRALQAIAVGISGRVLEICGPNSPTDWEIAQAALGTGKHSLLRDHLSYSGVNKPSESHCSYCWALWFALHGI